MAVSWSLKPGDSAKARGLASELGTRELTARILIARGLDTAEKASRFLSPRLSEIRPPLGMADMNAALNRLTLAVGRGEKIAVFGDYDVDGITSAAILTLTLRALGCEVLTRIARRTSGYGFSPEDAAAFIEAGVGLVLTGDCGTSDHAAISLCRRQAVDVIVIDHHQVPSGEVFATSLLNPHRADDTFPFKGLASCGVAFYLAASLRSRLRSQGDEKASRIEPRSLLDLVALGTIADLVPMVEENRILVANGLAELSKRLRPGMAALARVSGLAPGTIGTTDVSFRLAPRLNAAGRLGDAQLALDLFLTDDPAQATMLAEALEELNRERRVIQDRIWQEAMAAATEWEHDPVLVLGQEGWHQGVVGVVAAKLVEKYRKPAIVLGFTEGMGRGSARTLGGFNLYQSLAACGDHLLVYGGHAVAAGLTLAWENLGPFRQAFVAVAEKYFAQNPGEAPLVVDTEARLSEIDGVLAEEVIRLGPFGNGHPEPLVLLRGVKVLATRVVGSHHLQLTLTDGLERVEAIAFGQGDADPGKGACLDVVGVVEMDEFRGHRRSRLRVRHLLKGGS